MLRRDFLQTPLAVGPLFETSRQGKRRVGPHVPDELRIRAARLRRLDDVLGGGDTYRAYLAECEATAALLKGGSYGSQTGRGLRSVLAERATSRVGRVRRGLA